MNTTLLLFIVYLLEAIILWRYCADLFAPKFSPSVRVGFFLLGYLVCFLIYLLNNVYINVIDFICLNFLLIFFLYHTKWMSALLHACLVFIVMECGELLVLSFSYGLQESLYSGEPANTATVVLSLFSKFLYFLFLQIILFIAHREEVPDGGRQKGSGFLFLVNLLSAAFYLVLTYIYFYSVFPKWLDYVFSICCVLILLIDFFVFAVYRQSQRQTRERTELLLQLQKETDRAVYYKHLQREDEKQNILLHDVAKHLNAIESLAQQAQSEEILSYLTEMRGSSIRWEPVRVCDNENLNALLSRYLRRVEKRGITFLTDIRPQSLAGLEYPDLTALICNLLDNAIEAAQGVADAKIELRIEPANQSVYTVLTCANSCETDPFDPYGTLTSHKKGNGHHGYGVKSIQRVVDRYEGYMHMEYQKERKRFYVILILNEHVTPDAGPKKKFHKPFAFLNPQRYNLY